MALITGALIVGGIVVGIGAGGVIWAACTQEERDKERKKQLQNENNHLKSAKNILVELNNNLEKAKENLMEGKKIFEQGGHVSGGVALANTETISCYNKLDDAIKYSNSLINDINNTINNNNKEINKL